VAEAAKITENVFRAVNIALVNELKMIFDRMGIDVWEVIDAAATKPFGYMPFYPGPGLGGHCIPVDPFYLSWKAREYGLNAQFIELAGEINIQQPDYAIAKLREVLDVEAGLPLSKARVLVVGAAYKKNVADVRESPAMEIMARLADLGAEVACLDPHVPVLKGFHRATSLEGQATVEQAGLRGSEHDAVLILTDHDAVDYGALAALGLPMVDTRNVLARKGVAAARVFKA
jgi:UDP-N-acetyl-D-glucosamine dehydrogenase